MPKEDPLLNNLNLNSSKSSHASSPIVSTPSLETEASCSLSSVTTTPSSAEATTKIGHPCRKSTSRDREKHKREHSDKSSEEWRRTFLMTFTGHLVLRVFLTIIECRARDLTESILKSLGWTIIRILGRSILEGDLDRANRGIDQQVFSSKLWVAYLTIERKKSQVKTRAVKLSWTWSTRFSSKCPPSRIRRTEDPRMKTLSEDCQSCRLRRSTVKKMRRAIWRSQPARCAYFEKIIELESLIASRDRENAYFQAIHKSV